MLYETGDVFETDWMNSVHRIRMTYTKVLQQSLTLFVSITRKELAHIPA
jgi:hypothetical protein